MYYHQTSANGASWDRGEVFWFWGRIFKGQGPEVAWYRNSWDVGPRNQEVVCSTHGRFANFAIYQVVNIWMCNVDR